MYVSRLIPLLPPPHTIFKTSLDQLLAPGLSRGREPGLEELRQTRHSFLVTFPANQRAHTHLVKVNQVS